MIKQNGTKKTQNPDILLFRNYGESQGIQVTQFNQGAVAKDDEGRLFFGGVNGFISFNPDQVMGNRNIPQIRITSIEIDGEKYTDTIATPYLTELYLTHLDKSFSIEFAALDYVDPAKNLYDINWNHLIRNGITHPISMSRSILTYLQVTTYYI